MDALLKDNKLNSLIQDMKLNLLRSFDELFLIKQNALEISTEQGIRTEWLKEKFIHVDTMDYNKLSRTDGKKYDLITLLNYNDDSIPISNILQRCYELLHDDGLLLISIENPSALKHIMSNTNKCKAKLTAFELENVLNDFRFCNTQFYHSMQNFEAPLLIYRQSPNIYNLNYDIFLKTQITGMHLYIPENLSWEIKANMIFFQEKSMHHFSNGIIAVCSKKEGVSTKTEWFVRKFSAEPHVAKKFRTQIDIVFNDNKFHVVRNNMGGCNEITENDINYKPKHNIYITGESYLSKTLNLLLKGYQINEVYQLVSEIIHSIPAQDDNIDEDGFLLVEGIYMDYIGCNLIRKNDTVYFIDQKWDLGKRIPLDFIAYRNLKYISNIEKRCFNSNQIYKKIYTIMMMLFSSYSYNRYQFIVQMELETMNTIIDNEIEFYPQNKDDVMQSKSELLNYIKNKEQELYTRILNQHINTETYIWGSGEHTRKLLQFLTEHDFDMKSIKGIIDNNKKRVEAIQSLDGFPVIWGNNFLNDIASNQDCTDIIISSFSSQEGIAEQLDHYPNLHIISLYEDGETFKVIY